MSFRSYHVLIAAIAVSAMVSIIGCEPLHRDIEKELPSGDAGVPDDVADENDADECVPGEVCGPCEQGETVCQDGTTFCQNFVDLDEDIDNCGECGNVCETSASGVEVSCQSGQCIFECQSPGETFCQDFDACVDLDEDIDNCGACGNTCQTSIPGLEASCQSGVCDVQCEVPGENFCEEDDVCVDLDTDLEHCGDCGDPCQTSIPGAEASCQSGVCEVQCEMFDDTFCEEYDVCVDLDEDIDHCGGCGNACETSLPDAEVFCEFGECAGECEAAGESYCVEYDACVDLDTDVEHCGECGNACSTASGEGECVDGECACTGELELCDDECVDTQSDDDHCGWCGNNCPGVHTCVEGQCTN